MEPTIIVEGGLTRDPELRFGQSGKAFTSFSVAHTPRVKRNETWENGTPVYFNCKAFGRLAENIAESLRQGDRVVVSGVIKGEQWESNGEQRRGQSLMVDAIGASLTFATVTITRNGKGSQTGATTPRKSAAPAASTDVDDDPFSLQGEPPF